MAASRHLHQLQCSKIKVKKTAFRNKEHISIPSWRYEKNTKTDWLKKKRALYLDLCIHSAYIMVP